MPTFVGYLMPNPVYTCIFDIILIFNKSFVGNILNKQEFICSDTVNWFQVLLSNSNNLI